MLCNIQQRYVHHQKPKWSYHSHIAPAAIKYTIAKGHITDIQLDPELKPKFCEACAKAKVA